ncbi:LuxR C-terminal-related transcriptional regulator [Amycolatopsis australiensis]|uniref:DNA-binding response regulator, NarL/FixJ family, contains REC and HTH domains n=1 Tax=Amycolatopsis australiensis TaxID=546364 RepID=A0A1K1SJI1_9PSEU|nr:response regulator transcription factor [Amycolatopsis australiensis]SFW84442.1 DNA-binding response regulator, NarL/FixJ family, contains REC and HTH domains [Amycolatopsis australiensis]
MVAPPVRVVVAERDPAVRARLGGLLAEADGIELVGAVPDATAAGVTVRRRLPDVVLLDLRLGPLGPVARRPAVLALVTFDSDAAILRALRDGASGFLLRSARRKELIRLVRLAADGHRVLSPDAARRLVSAATRLSGPRDERLARVDSLTGRERQVLAWVGQAATNAEIATRLEVTEPVARSLVAQVVRKLGCAHRTEAGLLAYERGLCHPG